MSRTGTAGEACVPSSTWLVLRNTVPSWVNSLIVQRLYQTLHKQKPLEDKGRKPVKYSG